MESIRTLDEKQALLTVVAAIEKLREITGEKGSVKLTLVCDEHEAELFGSPQYERTVVLPCGCETTTTARMLTLDNTELTVFGKEKKAGNACGTPPHAPKYVN